MAIVGHEGGLIGLPLDSLMHQLHSTFAPNACSMKASKRISWAIVSRIAAGIAWPCRWQSQEQLSPRHWCSPMPQAMVDDPGYGQSVLIPAPPKRRHVALPPCPLSETRPTRIPNRAHCYQVPAGGAIRSTNVQIPDFSSRRPRCVSRPILAIPTLTSNFESDRFSIQRFFNPVSLGFERTAPGRLFVECWVDWSPSGSGEPAPVSRAPFACPTQLDSFEPRRSAFSPCSRSRESPAAKVSNRLSRIGADVDRTWAPDSKATSPQSYAREISWAGR